MSDVSVSIKWKFKFETAGMPLYLYCMLSFNTTSIMLVPKHSTAASLDDPPHHHEEAGPSSSANLPTTHDGPPPIHLLPQQQYGGCLRPGHQHLLLQLDFLTSSLLGNHISSTLTLNTGVPQGSVLSPHLFTWDCTPVHGSHTIIVKSMQRLKARCTDNLVLNTKRTKEIIVDYRKTKGGTMTASCWLHSLHIHSPALLMLSHTKAIILLLTLYISDLWHVHHINIQLFNLYIMSTSGFTHY